MPFFPTPSRNKKFIRKKNLCRSLLPTIPFPSHFPLSPSLPFPFLPRSSPQSPFSPWMKFSSVRSLSSLETSSWKCLKDGSASRVKCWRFSIALLSLAPCKTGKAALEEYRRNRVYMIPIGGSDESMRGGRDV